MSAKKPQSHGFSLLEILIVITLMSIIAVSLLPSTQSSVHEQLTTAAQVLSADLSYARSLAVTNNSKYSITFDIPNNTYTLTHTGANPVLNTLPDTPFKSEDDPATEQSVAIGELPQVMGTVKLVSVFTQDDGQASTPTATTTIELEELGNTANTDSTYIWLSAGEGNQKRYLSVRVNPVTGLSWIENFQSAAPPVATPGS